jgi:serine O-acetyltransferase
MSLRDDVRVIFERDPAATNLVEVLLTYPGLHALITYRIAHWLRARRIPLLPRLVSHFGRLISGIEIHPGAKIGRGFFIDHGMGVVIGETAEIGDNVTLYQGVTLGGTGKERGKRHPTLGSDIVVGSGAKILGAINIGDGVRIGAGAVVLRDVPPHSTAVGVPAKIVAQRQPDGTMRRIEQNPDPEMEMIGALRRNFLRLEQRIAALEVELRVAREGAGAADQPARRLDSAVEPVTTTCGQPGQAGQSGQNGHAHNGRALR